MQNQSIKDFSAKLIKYLFVGGSAAMINWAVFYMLVLCAGWNYLLGGFISFILATLWNFVLARKFIFHISKHSLLKESMLIYAVSFGGLLIDISVLYAGVEILEIDEMPSKILATGAAFIFNFGMRNFVIYNNNKKAES